MKKKIMIVDDEKDFLKITELNLNETNRYDVMTLSSANGIISQIHSFKPDVILIDLLMPEIGGMEVCEILNNDPIGSKIPIILLTALDKNIDKLEAYKLGIVDRIIKPVEADDLIARIEKALMCK